MVHHRAVDAVRRENTQRRRSAPLADEVSERNVTPAEGADHAALASVAGAEVRMALQRLPEDQRQVLTLAHRSDDRCPEEDFTVGRIGTSIRHTGAPADTSDGCDRTHTSGPRGAGAAGVTAT